MLNNKNIQKYLPMVIITKLQKGDNRHNKISLNNRIEFIE